MKNKADSKYMSAVIFLLYKYFDNLNLNNEQSLYYAYGRVGLERGTRMVRHKPLRHSSNASNPQGYHIPSSIMAKQVKPLGRQDGLRRMQPQGRRHSMHNKTSIALYFAPQIFGQTILLLPTRQCQIHIQPRRQFLQPMDWWYFGCD